MTHSLSSATSLGSLASKTILGVNTLSLQHFRNYESTRIETTTPLNVFTGRNGAGKTNILEALSLLTPGRGLRRAKLSEIDQARQVIPWTVTAQVDGIRGKTQIGTAHIDDEGMDKRLVKIDGKIASQTQLSSHLAMLWLTPQMEQLFLESASAGRKFLDRLVYGFDATHAARVNSYDQVMRERNKLLENGPGDDAWLTSLEQKMAEIAAAIAYARLDVIAHLNYTIAHAAHGFPKAQLSIKGLAESRLQTGEPAVAVEQFMQALWAAERGKDAAAGRTLQGAHRSEFQVFHTEKQMMAEHCSTGEQKTLLLSIVLAQARTTAVKKGLVPILIFDEVAAHLDPIRRLELFEEICQIGAQTWMTGTDPDLFSDLTGKATFFEVQNGSVQPT